MVSPTISPPRARPEPFTVPAGLVLQLVELVARWEVTSESLLESTRLAGAALDEAVRVPLGDYLDVVRRARSLTGEPGLGFSMGLHARVSAYGHLGFAVMSAATLREGIDIAIRFASMTTTALGLRLRVEGNDASLIVEEHADFGDVRDVIVIARLSGLWKMSYLLTGRDPSGTAEMAFPEPAYHARFAHLVPPARYDQPTNRIVMKVEALDYPLIMADPVALRLALEQCEKVFDASSSADRFVHTVRKLLWKEAGGFRSLEEVAGALHVSASTLKRQLAQRGSAMSDLLQEERRDRALLLLRSSELSVDDVADRLGYFSAQNFSRAFRRWTGKTPSAYRRSGRPTR
jgi:AraC-like DNA-binding protein